MSCLWHVVKFWRRPPIGGMVALEQGPWRATITRKNLVRYTVATKGSPSRDVFSWWDAQLAVWDYLADGGYREARMVESKNDG